MTKTQLKTLATKIHGLAVKSANGKKTAQNKALEKIATLLNQAIEAEINHYQLKVGSMVIWLEAGSQAKATSPTGV